MTVNVEMNVEIGAEAALFPEKEYIKGIFVAVWTVECVLKIVHAMRMEKDKRDAKNLSEEVNCERQESKRILSNWLAATRRF